MMIMKGPTKNLTHNYRAKNSFLRVGNGLVFTGYDFDTECNINTIIFKFSDNLKVLFLFFE